VATENKAKVASLVREAKAELQKGNRDEAFTILRKALSMDSGRSAVTDAILAIEKARSRRGGSAGPGRCENAGPGRVFSEPTADCSTERTRCIPPDARHAGNAVGAAGATPRDQGGSALRIRADAHRRRSSNRGAIPPGKGGSAFEARPHRNRAGGPARGTAEAAGPCGILLGYALQARTLPPQNLRRGGRTGRTPDLRPQHAPGDARARTRGTNRNRSRRGDSQGEAPPAAFLHGENPCCGFQNGHPPYLQIHREAGRPRRVAGPRPQGESQSIGRGIRVRP